MDIENAALAKRTSKNWGVAIFPDGYKGDKKPVVSLIQFWKKDGEEQASLCGSWYAETLLESKAPYLGLYIDIGQDWKCPGEEYEKIYSLIASWMKIYNTPNVPKGLL